MPSEIIKGERFHDGVADRIVEVIATRRTRITVRVEQCLRWPGSVGHEFQVSRAEFARRYTKE